LIGLLGGQKWQSTIRNLKSKIKESALYPDSDASYRAEYVLNLDQVEPLVACPPDVDNVKPLSQVAGQRVDMAFIGTCTNGRIEDLTAAAEVLRGQRVNVDAAAMKLVKSPQSFDVLVTTNLFGDILSDEASALVGGLGVAPSANVGEGTPVFEPVHGSAPDIEGKGVANPVGALLSAAMLLDTLGQAQAAQPLREAIRATLAAGIRTPDLGGSATTGEFMRAVCQRLA